MLAWLISYACIMHEISYRFHFEICRSHQGSNGFGYQKGLQETGATVAS